jgi:hypothetical protein
VPSLVTAKSVYETMRARMVEGQARQSSRYAGAQCADYSICATARICIDEALTKMNAELRIDLPGPERGKSSVSVAALESRGTEERPRGLDLDDVGNVKGGERTVRRRDRRNS